VSEGTFASPSVSDTSPLASNRRPWAAVVIDSPLVLVTQTNGEAKVPSDTTVWWTTA
jgi:hypothetical protein